MTQHAGDIGQIAAVVAAAGRSVRMGALKQTLPWEGGTVLGAVVEHLHQAGARPIVVVLGHDAESVRTMFRRQAVDRADGVHRDAVTFALNPDYLAGEMLSSYQAGLRQLQAITPLDAMVCGTLLALGDQPHVPPTAIRRIIARAMQDPHAIAMPSYQMRRGHPFYLPAGLWDEVLALAPSDTLRTLIRRYEDMIHYVEVDTPAVLHDIDTPDDYAALRSG